MGFWDEPQGAAVFKHAVLRQYAPIFVAKVGRTSDSHRVEIVDGYAGQGWYDNGDPGSPAVLLNAADTLSAVRNVHCTFIEEDRTTFSKLKARLSELGVGEDRATILHGSMSDHLDEVLDRAIGVPLFAFVDPYGLGLPFDELVGKIMRRSRECDGRRVPTEVLVNFIHSGIYRSVGYVTPNTSNTTQLKYAEQRILDLNGNLKGDWWQDLARTASGNDLVTKVRHGYTQRVLRAAGPSWQCLEMPVSDTTAAKPIYDLILFTEHPQGRWFFNDAISLARQVFATFCADGFMQAPLWEPEDDWVNEIEANLRRLLLLGQPVRVVDSMLEVFGRTLGQARGKHVKKAAQRLVSSGLVLGNLRHEPHQLVLQPAPSVERRASHSVA